jgi:hypothetical protein
MSNSFFNEIIFTFGKKFNSKTKLYEQHIPAQNRINHKKSPTQANGSCGYWGYMRNMRVYRRCAAYKKKPTHKQHFWFFADTKANAEKPKELFFANARNEIKRRN